MKQRGLFIVIEGIDGAGKTTQAELLQKHLESMGRSVCRTAEPTPFESGIALRAALGGKVKKNEWEMATMFVLDRIAHNTHPEDGIEAILDRGTDIICDRYYYSTLAYQGHSTNYEWVKSMNLGCDKIRKPDICIYLDLTPAQSLERILKGRDSVEIYENEETLGKVRAAFFRVFEDLKDSENIAIIDAYRDVETISADICKKADAILAK